MTMTPYNTDLTRCLKWMHNNAPNLQSIINQKADWYEKYQTTFWSNYQTNIYDIRTANAFGLVIWCIILGVPLDLFNFEPLTNDWAYGASRGNYLDGGGNAAPFNFVSGPNVYANGVLVASGNYTFTAATGAITFTTAPANGAVLTWTGTITQNETGQELIVQQPRQFGTGNGTATSFSFVPSDSANYNETGNNFYGGGSDTVSLLTEVRQACQLRYVALVSNGRQQWINQMLRYIFNGGDAWDFPNKKYFYLTDATQATQGVVAANIWRNDWQGNQQVFAFARTNKSVSAPNFATYNTTLTTASGTAPDGTNTAVLATATAGGDVYYLSNNSSGMLYTYSVWLKAGTVSTLIIKNDKATTVPTATFNLSTGTVSGVANATATITAYSNGWYRCTLTFTEQAVPPSQDSFVIYPNGSAGTFYFWGPQWENNGAATSYIYTTTAAVTYTDLSLNTTTGLVTFATAPVSGAALTWDGTWNWASSSTPQSFGTGDGTTTAFTLSQLPGAVKPVSGPVTNYMEYRIGAELDISAGFLNIMNDSSYGIMPQCAGIQYKVVQES